MRRIWEYLKQFGWKLPAGLLAAVAGVILLSAGIYFARSQSERALYQVYRRYSDSTNWLLLLGMIFTFAGAVATVFSLRTRD